MGRDAVLTHGSQLRSGEPASWYWLARRWAVLREATLRLWSDDVFGLAGNVAFRALLAIFPFLLFTNSLMAFVGDPAMADDLEDFLIAIVPQALVEPIISERLESQVWRDGWLWRQSRPLPAPATPR